MKRILVLAMMFAAGGAQAKGGGDPCKGEVLKHPSKVQLCKPEGWVQEEKEGVLKIRNAPKGSWQASLRLEPVDQANLDAALKNLDKKISDLVPTVTWGKSTKLKKDDGNPNHMDGIVMSGTGKRKDTNGDAGVMVAMVVSPSGKLILVSLIADAAWLGTEANLKTVKVLLDSLQPTE